jgi:hypothetical protein
MINSYTGDAIVMNNMKLNRHYKTRINIEIDVEQKNELINKNINLSATIRSWIRAYLAGEKAFIERAKGK